MTPAARVQAAIELLDGVVAAAREQGPPADRLIADGMRQRRYAGSKDRRAIRDHVFAAIRACGPLPVSGRAAMLRLAQTKPDLAPLFDGSPYGPAAIDPGEPVADGGLAPIWLVERLAASGITGANADALLGRAPLDIRINPLRPAPQLPEPGEPTAAPAARRYPAGTQVERWDAYAEGAIEVQDTGSQLAAAAVAAAPGETIVDLCAGAGGKTLALAADLGTGGGGRLIACDTDRGRLSRLGPRAVRAGADGVETILLDPGREMERLAPLRAGADAVMVDAPCSGTGTWRRNPEARWRLRDGDLPRFAATQDRLLVLAAELVRPGGRLVFVTCSVLDDEGAIRADAFLAAHPGWRADPPALPLGQARGAGMRLTPHADATDGFFIARFTAPW